ncbi:MAG: acyl-CoA dehydrogenase domain protein [Actinomycetia bacterium]|nr:acyl-CoA dehydrogenase domain protein [Actinomycetes bacterium]
MTTSQEVEDVESFRLRAREWIRANISLATAEDTGGLRAVAAEVEFAAVARDRALQRKLHDAGLNGLIFPREYGGQGLTPAHQQALNEELAGYKWPSRFQVPTISPCGAVLLEFAPEELKKQHIPAILRGEEIWMQFLSEPSGGSDLAGALTTAVRDGDEWVLNGSKVWTTGAWWADWAICLARTDWDVPKHQGLTVFALPIHQDGIVVRQIEMLNGAMDFCQEYLTDVRVPDSCRIGEVNGGWTVATRLLFHERMQHSSPYVTNPAGGQGVAAESSPVRIARDAGRLADPVARDLIGEARVLGLASEALQQRVSNGVRSGVLTPDSAAVARVLSIVGNLRTTQVRYEIAGDLAAAWSDEDGGPAGIGDAYLMRQVASIGGGTTEMARNVVAERVLGMPREQTRDRGIPFRDVPRGASR